MGYKEYILAMNPVSYYRFGESSGPTVVDEMGVQNGTYIDNVTLGVGGPPIVTDGNKAIQIDRTTPGYPEMPDNALHRQKNISIDFWFKLTSMVYRNLLVQKWGPGGIADDCYSTWIETNGAFYYGISTVNGQQIKGNTVAAIITTGVWYHCQLVYTIDGRLRLYINGTKYADQTNVNCNNQNIGPGVTPLWVGGDYYADFGDINKSDALFDELAIFNYDINPDNPGTWAITPTTPTKGRAPFTFSVEVTPQSGQTVTDYLYNWNNVGFGTSRTASWVITTSQLFVVELDIQTISTGAIVHYTEIYDLITKRRKIMIAF